MVCFKYWTLNLRPPMVSPKVSFHPYAKASKAEATLLLTETSVCTDFLGDTNTASALDVDF